MTPEEEQQIKEYSRAIAKILYKSTTGEQLTSLAKIEEVVRSQMRKHVMPEVGFFYRKCHRRKQRIQTKNKKYYWRTANYKLSSTKARN